MILDYPDTVTRVLKRVREVGVTMEAESEVGDAPWPALTMEQSTRR